MSSGSGGRSAGHGESQGFTAYRLVIFAIQQTVLVMLVDDVPCHWAHPVWYQELAALLVAELQPLTMQLADQHLRLQVPSHAQAAAAATGDRHSKVYLYLQSSAKCERLCSMLPSCYVGSRGALHIRLLQSSESRCEVIPFHQARACPLS